MKNKKALITGATGFLGRHLVKDLISKNIETTILVRKSSNLKPFEGLPLKVVYGDINDRLCLLQACEEQDRVYHLAGYIAYKRSERELMEKINVDGTANVIDACITNKVPQLLHLSSVVTIGANFKAQPIDEDFTFNLSPYQLGYFETKRKAEELIIKAFHEDNLNGYLVNPATIYGAGDGTKGSRKTQIKVAQGKFPFYPPGGVNVVYVNDVIKGIDLCLEKGKPARRYILAGDNLYIKELFEIIAEVSQVKKPNIPLPGFLLFSLGFIGDMLKKFDIDSSLSSETAVTASLYHWFKNDRAIKELGFEPTPARIAIEESISWMKKNGLLEK